MEKTIKLIGNKRGGIDMITTYPQCYNLQVGGNNVQVSTGDSKESLQYWKEIKRAAETAIEKLEAPVIHVVVVNADHYRKRK